MADKSSTPRLVLEGGTNLETRLQRGVPISVGQARGVDLNLPHPSVAPIHCDVLWEGDGVLLRSRNPEFPQQVNGRAMVGETWLRHDDQFSVGQFLVRLDWPSQSAPAGSAEPQTYDTSYPGEPATVTEQPQGGGDWPVVFRSRNVEEVPINSRLTLGSSDDCDVVLEGREISPIHLQIEASDDGWLVTDKGQSGSLLNGRFFESKALTIGDFLSLGDYCFRYDGYALQKVAGTEGCGILALGLSVERHGGHKILEDASFEAKPGHFVGILGPSGAGKTTLLKALIGLYKVKNGDIWIDGRPISSIADLSRYLGFVPQQEIVHLELTARQALMFSARLRLPKRTPIKEIQRLTVHLAERLGLTQHLDKRAGNLSGGQLKRLSVCVELLNRPSLLFLDEPTSGLDPESETELMRHLQELPHTGCTVVATTHLMENVYLMNRIEVVMAGVDEQTQKALPGTTIFRGKPREAREFFQVKNLTKLYGKLAGKARDYWRDMFREKHGALNAPANAPARDEHRRRHLPRRFALPILVQRHLAVLSSDIKNLLLLLLQPVFIGLLIGVVAIEPTSSGTQLFLAYIAALWLGCSNSATELVRERSIFRRENFVGLSAAQYLFAKFSVMSSVTSVQALVLFGIVKFTGGDLMGDPGWQISCLLLCAVTSTCLGLAISAWAKTGIQAVLMVPVFIIPQILFSGMVFP